MKLEPGLPEYDVNLRFEKDGLIGFHCDENDPTINEQKYVICQRNNLLNLALALVAEAECIDPPDPESQDIKQNKIRYYLFYLQQALKAKEEDEQVRTEKD